MTNEPRPEQSRPPATLVSQFTATVTRITDLTHDVREIGLRLVDPDRMAFLPGQFVSFEIDRPGARFKMTRAYTIVSPPDDDREIVLLLNHVERGPGSEYLFSLRAGDDTHFKGPYGAFTASVSQRDALFVAEDTGIAPFRSMLYWMAEHDRERTVTLLWGLQRERDVYYLPELEALRGRLSRFSFLVSLANPSSAWTGERAPVAQLVAERIASVDNLEAYLCGGSAMIAAAAAAIKAKGLCPIRKEQYYIDKPK